MSLLGFLTLGLVFLGFAVDTYVVEGFRCIGPLHCAFSHTRTQTYKSAAQLSVLHTCSPRSQYTQRLLHPSPSLSPSQLRSSLCAASTASLLRDEITQRFLEIETLQRSAGLPGRHQDSNEQRMHSLVAAEAQRLREYLTQHRHALSAEDAVLLFERSARSRVDVTQLLAEEELLRLLDMDQQGVLSFHALSRVLSSLRHRSDEEPFVQRVCREVEKHLNRLSKPKQHDRVLTLHSLAAVAPSLSPAASSEVERELGGALTEEMIGNMMIGMRNFEWKADASQRLIRSVGYAVRVFARLCDTERLFSTSALSEGLFSLSLSPATLSSCFQGIRHLPATFKVRSWFLQWMVRSVRSLSAPLNGQTLSALLSASKSFSQTPFHTDLVFNLWKALQTLSPSHSHFSHSSESLPDLSVGQFAECLSALKRCSSAETKPLAVQILSVLDSWMRKKISLDTAPTTFRSLTEASKSLNALANFQSVLSLSHSDTGHEEEHRVVLRVLETIYSLMRGDSSWKEVSNVEEMQLLGMAIQGMGSLDVRVPFVPEILSELQSAIENAPVEVKQWNTVTYAAAISGLDRLDVSHPRVAGLISAITNIPVVSNGKGYHAVYSVLRSVRLLDPTRKEAASVLLQLDKWVSEKDFELDFFLVPDIMMELQNLQDLSNPAISKLFDRVLTMVTDDRHFRPLLARIDAHHVQAMLLGVKSMNIAREPRVVSFVRGVVNIVHISRRIEAEAIACSDAVQSMQCKDLVVTLLRSPPPPRRKFNPNYNKRSNHHGHQRQG